MNAQDLYDNVLQGRERESFHFSDDDFSPKSNLALYTTFSGTPCRRLSLSSNTCDTPRSSLFDSTEFSISSSPDNHGSNCGHSMMGPTFTPWHHKATSKRRKENSVSPYSPASLPSCSHGQNVMTKNADSSPLKKKYKMMLPCQKHVFSSQDSISDDSGTSSHDSGYFESGKKIEEDSYITRVGSAPAKIKCRLSQSKTWMSLSPVKQVSLVSSATTTTTTATLTPAHLAEGQRPFKRFPSLTFDEDDADVVTELMNEVRLQDEELWGLSGLLAAPIHVAKFCSPTKSPSGSLVRHHLSMMDTVPTFSWVCEPLAGKENIYPIERSHSELGASAVESKLRKLDPLRSSSEPEMNCCHSETHVAIMKALNKSYKREENLTGDFSKALLLPILEIGKHPDLQSISVHTLADVIKGKYNDKLASCRIIDCRYPYEYDGGHIKGAELWHLPELVTQNLRAKKGVPFIAGEEEPRHIMVFHCEFSTERGPKAQRLLRQIDRSANKEHYPALYFPELYLLEGGYKAFYEKYSELCTPCSYVRMVDPKYNVDLKHFRTKSRSWAGEKKHSKSRMLFPGLNRP